MTKYLDSLVIQGVEYKIRSWWSSDVFLTAVSDLAATAWNTIATITYTETTDVVLEWVTLAKFSNSVIVRKEGSEPTSIDDWTVVYTNTTAWATVSYEDTWLTNDTTYYYRVFSTASNGNVTESSSVSVTPVSYYTMTLTIDESKSDPEAMVTYWDDVKFTQWSSDWDNWFGYYRCKLSTAWKETAVETQKDWVFANTLTTTSGDDVMVKFPRMWIKSSKSWNVITIQLTDNPNADGFQYNAFNRWWEIQDQFYIWAYLTSNNNKSLSGASPTVSQTRATFRSNASSKWSYWHQYGWCQREFINVLYLFKYKNLNSQSAVGMWYVDGSAKVNTWWTDSQTEATYWTTSSTTQMRLFWVEDWWWNIWQWVENMWSDSSRNYCISTTNACDDSTYDTTISSWISSNSSWYMNKAIWNQNWIFLPSWFSGDASTYYSDYCYLYAGGFLGVGGDRSSGSSAGAFHCDVKYSASESFSNVGSRLMYL